MAKTKEKIIKVYIKKYLDIPLVLTDKGNLFLRDYHTSKNEYNWKKIELPEELKPENN